MKKRILSLLLALVLFSGLLPALRMPADAAGVAINETNFPDPNFREHVRRVFDTNSDGYLSEAERNVTEVSITAKNVVSMKGIEYFTSIKTLSCVANRITSLDVSKNTELTSLVCSNNELTSLDVSKNTKLEDLWCDRNYLESLDVSKNTALEELWAYDNNFTELKLGKNSVLREVLCQGNPGMSTLDVSRTPRLRDAVLHGTKDTSDPNCDRYSSNAGYLKVNKGQDFQTEFIYPLKVCDREVTDENRRDVLGNGVFSFDGVSTLTVRGDCNSTACVIENIGVQGLRIKVLEDSTLKTSGLNVILARADTTITGPGKLTLENSNSGGCGVYALVNGVTLTLELVQVGVSSHYGIVGPNGGNQTKLVVDHSTVTVKSAEGGAVCDFGGGILLRDCRIVLPINGALNPAGTGIVKSNGELAESVRISWTERTNPFTDVKETDPYYDAVLWAYYHYPCQITAGKDETHFAPADTVTRAQAMTFLWKAADKPEPANSQNPFTDIKPGKYYYNPILWAYYYEPQITTGTSDTTYSPQKTCTRAQIITFLWNAMGRPVPKISNPYSDVSNKYYYTPALWAYEAGIEKGSGGKFRPNTDCTRASTVLYLYRFYTGRDLL